MRLVGLLTIAAGLAMTAMGLATVAHKGEDVPLATTSVVSLGIGIGVVIWTTSPRRGHGFDVILNTGSRPVPLKKEDDHG